MRTIHRTCVDDGSRHLCDRGARDSPYGSCRRHSTSAWGFGAGFWLRVLAYLMDAAILAVFAIPIVVGAAMAMGLGGILARIPRDGDPFLNGLPPIFLLFVWFCVLLGVCGTWLYYALLESSEWQGTAGKKALGLIVTDMQGRRVTFARASGRHFGKIVTSFIPLGIGYAMAGFTQKRQALHDILASSLVLRKG
jgi:uncharacterized RDD family membrane protein YckC